MLYGLKYNAMHSLCVSACIAFALHPYCIYNIGFILSYGMVFSLLIVGQLHPNVSYIHGNFLTFIAQIPWSYLFWQKLALLSPLANCIALPWLSDIILPCVLALIPISACNKELNKLLLQFIELQWQYLAKILTYISQFDVS